MSAPRKIWSNGQEIYNDEDISLILVQIRENNKFARETLERSGFARGPHARVIALAKIARKAGTRQWRRLRRNATTRRWTISGTLFAALETTSAPSRSQRTPDMAAITLMTAGAATLWWVAPYGVDVVLLMLWSIS